MLLSWLIVGIMNKLITYYELGFLTINYTHTRAGGFLWWAIVEIQYLSLPKRHSGEARRPRILRLNDTKQIRQQL